MDIDEKKTERATENISRIFNLRETLLIVLISDKALLYVKHFFQEYPKLGTINAP